MTPDPPSSSSDGQSLPPRHRPTLGNLTKDTTELDLWAFEDDLDAGESAPIPVPVQSPRTSVGDIPAPRERQVVKIRETDPSSQDGITSGGDRIQMNVNKGRQKNQPSGPVTGASKPESDFDDLEHWEDIPRGPQIDELPDEPLAQAQERVTPPDTAPPAAEPPGQTPMATAQPAPAEVAEDDEFSPAPRADAAPLSLFPRLKLSKVERIGLIALLALLAVGGPAALLFSLKRLPTESARADTRDFPIQGAKITINSALSYWRAPITGGPTPDTFRRGTQLLPVLELKIGAGSGAVRVLFRNEERAVIGDAVTRAIRGAGSLKIPATAGFDDLGMHAAYRTGGSKPWTIEVFEATSENASGRDFEKLFEMNISTDRR